MEENVKMSNEVNPEEIDAIVQAILEETDVIEILKKISVSPAEIYKEASKEVVSLSQKTENSEKAAKKLVKEQVLKILMEKESEKITEDTNEKTKKEMKKFLASEEQQQAYNTGNINAILRMIQNDSIIIGSDGKTATKLTPEQRKELVKLIKEGYLPLSGILKELEFEDEEIEEESIVEEKEDEDKKEILQDDSIETNEVSLETEDIDKEEIEDSTITEEYDEIDEEEKEDVEKEDKSTKQLEDYNFRVAKDEEKNDALENNPEYGKEYESVICYIPPLGITIEQTAQIVMQVQRENPNQKLTVSFNNILIDPQRFSSPTEIIEKFKEEVDKRKSNKENRYQDALDMLTTDVLEDKNKVAGLSPIAKDMEDKAREEKIIANMPNTPAMDEQQQPEDDEHPYPEFPGER